MRISDWSSDVCSSDLVGARLRLRRQALVGAKFRQPLAGQAGGDQCDDPSDQQYRQCAEDGGQVGAKRCLQGMYQVSKCMSISPLDRRARAGRESIASAAQCRTRRSDAEHTEPGVNMAWGWAIERAPVGGGVMGPGAPGVVQRASEPS